MKSETEANNYKEFANLLLDWSSTGEENCYTVVGENHRLSVMKYIWDHEGQDQQFKSVTYRVYNKLTSTEALCLCFNRNRESSDVLGILRRAENDGLRHSFKPAKGLQSDG